MSKIKLLYLGNYKPDEQKVMEEAGLSTARMASSGFDSKAIASLTDSLLFIRGPKMRLEEYAALFKEASGVGVQFVTSPKSFEILNRFELHQALLRDMMPRSLMIDASLPTEIMYKNITAEMLIYPLFIRSETESAAKYVGIEGCTMYSENYEELRVIIKNLREHVRDFASVIVKEMVPIAKSAQGVPLEYRAIGALGKLIVFDYGSSSQVDAPEKYHLDGQANRAFNVLAVGGATGVAFIDFGVTTSGKGIIVECKDFITGSITYPKSLATAFKNLG
jgi:hypothetical protein